MDIENKRNDERKWLFIFVTLIFLFGLSLKILLAYVIPVYHDVGWYRSLAEHHDSAFMNLIELEHPPFGYYPFLLFLKMFGIHDFVLRFVPLLFSLIELFVVYYIAKKWFGQRTALFTIILFSLTYFATINALSVEGDGSILGFISLLLFYFFYEYYRTSEKKYLILSGIFFGLILLIKVRAVLFIIPLFLYCIYKTKNLFRMMQETFILLFFGGLIFMIFPLLVYLTSPDEFITLLFQVVLHNTGQFSLLYKLLHPLLFLQIFVVLSFLYLFLFIEGIQKQGNKKLPDSVVLLIFWFCSMFFILLAILPEAFAALYPRYTAFLVPPLIILSGRGLAFVTEKFQIGHKKLCLLFLCTIFLSIFLLFANQHATDYWYLVITSMGIIKLSKTILISVTLISGLLLLVYYCMKKKKQQLKSWIVSLLFVLLFSFNLLLITEPLIDQTHRHLINDLVDFYRENNIAESGMPIFTWAKDVPFYLGISAMNVQRITNPELQAYAKCIGYSDEGYYYIYLHNPIDMEVLKEQGGIVFSYYYPLKYTLEVEGARKAEYEYLMNKCTLLYDSSYTHGKAVVFYCAPFYP